MSGFSKIKNRIKDQLVSYAKESHKTPTPLKPAELCLKERVHELESTLKNHTDKIFDAYEKLQKVYQKSKPSYSIDFLESNFMERAAHSIDRKPPSLGAEALSLGEVLGVQPEDLKKLVHFITEELPEDEQGAKVDYFYLVAHLVGDDPELWRQHGQLAEIAGGLTPAIESYKLAYLVDPTYVVCLLEAAFAYYEAGDMQEATKMLDVFDQAVEGVEEIDDLLEIAQEIRLLIADAP